MPAADIPKNEIQRLNVLKSYDILDSLPEQEFDDIVDIAAQVTDAPIALISLVDQKRQWFKAKKGLEATETDRASSFCAHAILDPDEMMIVEDPINDPRFADNPLVLGEPHIRFYAACPIVSERGGHPLGTLCVIDTKERHLDRCQIETLKLLGRQTAKLLEARFEKTILENMWNNVSDSAFDWDLDDNTIKISDHLMYDLGYDAEKSKSRISLKSWLNLIHPDDRAAAFDIMKQALDNEEDVSYTLEFRMRHTAQNWVWYLMEGAMMRNISDIPYRMVGRLKNIDDIKVGQKRLVAEESIRQTLVDVSYDGYWDWHVQDDYEYISPRFWQLLQCDPSDYDHSPSEWKKYILPEDEKILQQVLDAHIYSLGYKAFQCELRFRRKDGQIATLLCKGQVIEWDEHGRPLRVIRVHTDISEIKDAYLMQEELISKLNASNEELERFAYVASHDLKEPLRMVKCYAELIKEKYEALLDDKGQKYINYAYSGAVQMQEMIDDLLEYARLSSNNAEYHPEIVNMDDIIAHVLKNLDYAITASGANIKWYNIPDCVIGHPLKLVCVFQNLISNAIKYQAKGNIPEITITADNVDDKILFEVKDNGIGMNPDYVQRIFEPFKRLHNKKAYAGTGIGLAICRKAVENMSGTIWAEAEEGLGSTFYIALPQPEQFEDFLDEKYVA